MTRRIDPSRSQRGRVGNSRRMTNQLHRTRPFSKARAWEAVSESGEIVATCETSDGLRELFGLDFEIRVVK